MYSSARNALLCGRPADAGAMRRQRQAFDIWPVRGRTFALLIIIIFLDGLYPAQFFLGEIPSGRNQALERLNRQVAELSEVLSLERSTNARFAKTYRARPPTCRYQWQHGKLSGQLPNCCRSVMRYRRNSARRGKRSAPTRRRTRPSLPRSPRSIETSRHCRMSVPNLKRKCRNWPQRSSNGINPLPFCATSRKNWKPDLPVNRNAPCWHRKKSRKNLTIRELSAQAERIGDDLTKEQRTSQDARKQVEILNRQLTALRQQLVRLNAALEASEAKVAAQTVQIVSLGKRLNEALASKVQNLRGTGQNFSDGCAKRLAIAAVFGSSATVSRSSQKSCSRQAPQA